MDNPERPLLALGLRFAAIVLISTMFMLVKYAGETGIAAPEMMFWRQAVTIPAILVWLGAQRKLHRLATRRMASHATRAALGMTAMGLNFFAMMVLPLAEATTISFTTPVFAVILTALVLRDYVGPWRWSAVLAGFAGVLIITQPGISPIPFWGAAAGLAGSLAVAAVSFQIRDLARTDDPMACVFWFAVYGAMMMSILLPATMTAHTPYQWLLLLGLGLSGTIGQFLLTLSLKHGSVATVIVMDYSALIWATVYGWLIWDRLPALATWFGAPIIIAAGMVITWREHLRSRSVPPPSAMEGGQGT